ncbi:MAG: hypothetical protein FWF44_04300 [Defluviitaleaceae bacterium]|nr:hypothetical protein [Defluviitaleaceae bacterium]
MSLTIGYPAEAAENIIRTQGESGRAFLDSLPQKLGKYIEKWKLRECKFLAHSTNLIYSCKSEIYGDAVIKAGVPEDGRLLTEISAIKFNSENAHTCRLYDHSLKDGILLLERLTPGDTLKDAVSDPIKRTDVFLSIFEHYHLPCGDTGTYPTYASLIEAFEVNFDSYPDFKKYKDIERTLYNEINSDYSRSCLLHGDLHFRNILSHGGTFKVIDPHGIIGDPVFDITRFLTSELADAMRENRAFNQDIVLHIGKSLGLPVSLLYGLLAIDVIHHAAYHLGNPITKDMYEYNLKRCETAYELLRRG